MLLGIMIKSSICNCFPSGSIFIWLSGLEVPIRFLTWSSSGCGGLESSDLAEFWWSLISGGVLGGGSSCGFSSSTASVGSSLGLSSEFSDLLRSRFVSILDAGDCNE